jgi:Na+-translocating ferredoxin:NAD+ oxidoreductase RnfD subunit
MTEQPRDWDREMANIDRAIAKQQPVTTGPVQSGSASTLPQRRSVALTWFWTGLALLLGVALLLWPYDKNCGIRLIFFIGAGGLAFLAALVGALNSWAYDRGLAHLLSLLMIVWAGIMVAREVLPRVGYAKEARNWTCPSSEPAPTTAPAAEPTNQQGT